MQRIKMKTLINILVVLVVAYVDFGCSKKSKTYYISDTTKEYFSYQKGSYWIYSNDSTSVLDSTTIKTYWDFINGTYEDKERQLIVINFNSSFLSSFTLGYACTGPDEVSVASRENDTSYYVMTGMTAYNPDLFSSAQITVPDCFTLFAIELKHLPSITVNNLQYVDVIKSRMFSIDSSSSVYYYLNREMFFAKNVGIIKFIEVDKLRHLKRSWSLLRHKSIQ